MTGGPGLWLAGKSEKRGLGDRCRGSSHDELPLPIAPLVESLMGPLEFRRCGPMGEEEGEGKGVLGPLPRGFVLFSFFKREREGGGKIGRETSMCGCLSRSPYWGPALQPRHVP